MAVAGWSGWPGNIHHFIALIIDFIISHGLFHMLLTKASLQRLTRARRCHSGCQRPMIELERSAGPLRPPTRGCAAFHVSSR